MNPTLRKIIKQMASLKIAVVVILSLATVIAWGTIVEAQYDSSIASKIVYNSVWMYLVIWALMINLLAVMIDRWPWKAKHTGFVCAHIGIMVLFLGSSVTKYMGVDGSLAMGVGEKSNRVIIGEQDFQIFKTNDSGGGNQLYSYVQSKGRGVDFFLHPPASEPLTVPLPDATVDVVDYYPFAIRDDKVVRSDEDGDGSAVRFQIANANANVTDWLLQKDKDHDEAKPLGLARFVLTSQMKDFFGENVAVFQVLNEDKIKYAIFSRQDPKFVSRGEIGGGEAAQTPWMGMQIHILKILPHGKQDIKYVKLDKPTTVTVPALKIRFTPQLNASPASQNEKVKPLEMWMPLNSSVKLVANNSRYEVVFANRVVPLDFQLLLTQFDVGRYPGTTRAASYESTVSLIEKGYRQPTPERPITSTSPKIYGNIKISMNEPLKYGGFTFYQASFQEDENGRPVMSVLSVNRDPGRWIKYLGSIIIVFGVMHLFWYQLLIKRKKAV